MPLADDLKPIESILSFEKKGNFEQAERIFNETATQTPDWFYWYNLLTRVHQYANDNSEQFISFFATNHLNLVRGMIHLLMATICRLNPSVTVRHHPSGNLMPIKVIGERHCQYASNFFAYGQQQERSDAIIAMSREVFGS